MKKLELKRKPLKKLQLVRKKTSPIKRKERGSKYV